MVGNVFKKNKNTYDSPMDLCVSDKTPTKVAYN